MARFRPRLGMTGLLLEEALTLASLDEARQSFGVDGEPLVDGPVCERRGNRLAVFLRGADAARFPVGSRCQPRDPFELIDIGDALLYLGCVRMFTTWPLATCAQTLEMFFMDEADLAHVLGRPGRQAFVASAHAQGLSPAALALGDYCLLRVAS